MKVMKSPGKVQEAANDRPTPQRSLQPSRSWAYPHVTASGSPSNLRHLEKSDTIELHPPQQEMSGPVLTKVVTSHDPPPLLKIKLYFT